MRQWRLKAPVSELLFDNLHNTFHTASDADIRFLPSPTARNGRQRWVGVVRDEQALHTFVYQPDKNCFDRLKVAPKHETVLSLCDFDNRCVIRTCTRAKGEDKARERIVALLAKPAGSKRHYPMLSWDL